MSEFANQAVETAASISLVLIGISILLLLYRAVKGPTNADRAVALDAIGINLMGLCGVIAVQLATTQMNDVILLIGILLFIGTIAIAKFLEKGVIIDRDMD